MQCKKILISGGNGNLAKQLMIAASRSKVYSAIALDKASMDITDNNSLHKHIIDYNPNYFIHAAALTKPLQEHEENPCKSIVNNVIGTANVTMACIQHKIKLIYISTDYVYPGISGNYKEEDAVLPFTNYGWSKLGGECCVQMYANSLILRAAICNNPFPENKFYFDDMIKSYMHNDQAAECILSMLDMTGVYNLGGPAQSVYSFAKKDRGEDVPHCPTKSIDNSYLQKLHTDTSMNIDKLKNVMNIN